MSNLEFEYYISEISYYSEKVSRVIMASVNSESIPFIAGQYIYIEILSNKIVPYSIASSPTQNEIELIVCHKRNDTNINILLDKYNKKTPLRLSSAKGQSYYRETDNHLIALAGGVGIAPIKSIIDYLSISKTTKMIDLYHVVNCQKDLFLDKYYKTLASSCEQFTYTPVIINNRSLSKLYNLLISKYINFSNVDIYSFGSFKFTNEIFQYLSDFNLNNFFTDNKKILQVSQE